jgi:hypothetical protein
MRENRYRRRDSFRAAKEEVLVVCGGQTEELYFKAFNRVFQPSLGTVRIVTAMEARNPMQIVEYAIKARRQKDDYNAVWCVFDKDEFPDFDNAIEYAKSHGIQTAFSNQAFEVWFINHFRLLNSPLGRSHYKDELSKLLAFPYDKSKSTVNRVCEKLLTDKMLKTAIAHTRLGYERHAADTKPAKPSAYESCSTVFRLAKSLLDWTDI